MHALGRERVGNTIPTMPASGRGRADAEERLPWIRAEMAVEDAAVVCLGRHRRDFIAGFD